MHTTTLRLLAAIVALAGIFSHDSHAQGGPPGGIIWDLAVDPANASIVYAATYGGVFKSTNRGTRWTSVNSGIANRIVYSLAIHPSSTSTLYAATSNGLYKTTNGGASWSQTGLSGEVNSITIDPTTPLTLYAGTPGVPAKSTDGGVTWIGP
jgi:hypothetical protein